MNKRITLTDSDLEVLKLILRWRIGADNPTNNGNAVIGERRCKELLEKLTGKGVDTE